MKLPNADNAIVEEGKVLNYLLNLSHSDGWSKAKFFLQMGFNQNNWRELIKSLKIHAQETEVLSDQETTFGIKYVLEGDISSLEGKTYLVRTVWFISYNESIPKLVTAYPVEQ